ncbi:class I SAM-dependent methyltransferase [Uliginosibacterium sp. H1]|uniref:class I SAM-dependent methyltransferase n=1 Tax=Uliginosibacterium sp. H1 TaxID=3114757 RepID=UPI002E19DB9B|nr:class I SAM-dependent methyltransferase [Uliginosibacterium sp. H1]
MLHQLVAHLPAPIAERSIGARLADWTAEHDIPLTLELWNGKQFHLGASPQVLMRLRSPRALPHIMRPSLSSLASAYVEGLVDVEGPVQDVVRLSADMASRAGAAVQPRVARLSHSRKLDADSIQHHYDVFNEFYGLWLDAGMVYSCAYFRRADQTLEEAQLQKIDHILRKIRLQPGQSLLDIGCGWGALVLRAAQHFGARCVGVTLSHRQFELATQRVRDAGLQDRVEIRLQDYRDVPERFDRVTSVGMFEHVGLANLGGSFHKVHDLLEDDGIAMNHGITSSDAGSGGTPFGGGDFIDRYVFPNGELPHIGLTLQEMSAAGLEATDVENLRLHYAMTLQHWSTRFEANAGRLREIAGEKRFRVWRAYLAGCAHAFDANWIALHQIVATRPASLGRQKLPLTRDYMYR